MLYDPLRIRTQIAAPPDAAADELDTLGADLNSDAADGVGGFDGVETAAYADVFLRRVLPLVASAALLLLLLPTIN